MRRRRAPALGHEQRWPALLQPLLSWAAVIVGVGIVVIVVRSPAHGVEISEQALPTGPALYQRTCASCHGNQGQGTFRGPTLVAVGAASADYWLRSGRMPLREPDQQSQRQPPAFTDAQIRELVDYVATLGEGPPIPQIDLAGANLAEGGELYRLNCAACHNWDGKGGALVNQSNAPPLRPVPVRELAEAVRIGPGTMPLFTEDQLNDDQLADVLAYVEYMKTPPDAGGFGLGHWGPSTETLAGFAGLALIVGITAWLGERRRGR
jgi:ubiquinol-cytochrome c reductase cytochrome c subunit